MQKEDCYYLGKITKKHGFKGNLILHLDTDEPESYTDMESVFIEKDGILVPFFFEFIGPHTSSKLLAKFEDIGPDEAERLVNKSLYLPLNELPELEGTEFYFHEIIGFTIIDQQKGEVGKVKSVNDNGVQAILNIDAHGKEVLIPIINDWILQINRAEKFIKLQTPEGLIDLYLE